MPRLFAVIAPLVFLTLSACEMMEGLGRDVETTGEAITEESQEAQAGL
ncbi:MAG: hypothetical protein RIT14_405 [Pseudomonadota bacterium]|jgi:predicted small secreted protein